MASAYGLRLERFSILRERLQRIRRRITDCLTHYLGLIGGILRLAPKASRGAWLAARFGVGGHAIQERAAVTEHAHRGPHCLLHTIGLRVAKAARRISVADVAFPLEHARAVVFCQHAAAFRA